LIGITVIPRHIVTLLRRRAITIRDASTQAKTLVAFEETDSGLVGDIWRIARILRALVSLVTALSNARVAAADWEVVV
jgi:hypothetical protein